MQFVTRSEGGVWHTSSSRCGEAAFRYIPHSAVVIPCESARLLQTREKGGDESDPPQTGGSCDPDSGTEWHTAIRPHEGSLSSSFIPAGRLGTASHKLVFPEGGRGAGLLVGRVNFSVA